MMWKIEVYGVKKLNTLYRFSTQNHDVHNTNFAFPVPTPIIGDTVMKPTNMMMEICIALLLQYVCVILMT